MGTGSGTRRRRLIHAHLVAESAGNLRSTLNHDPSPDEVVVVRQPVREPGACGVQQELRCLIRISGDGDSVSDLEVLLPVVEVRDTGAAARLIGPDPGDHAVGADLDPVPDQMEAQLKGWLSRGITAVKMKVGADPNCDLQRVLHARSVVGPDAAVYVDANGAYTRKQALALADVFSAEAGVTWFEEPVSSDDLEGLRLLRERAGAGMDIAAGEYGYDLFYFRRMIGAGTAEVLQADVTRCGGITQMLQVGALCHSLGHQSFSAHQPGYPRPRMRSH